MWKLTLREAIKQHSFIIRLNPSEHVFFRILKQRLQLLRHSILNISILNVKHPRRSNFPFLNHLLLKIIIIENKNCHEIQIVFRYMIVRYDKVSDSTQA